MTCIVQDPMLDRGKLIEQCKERLNRAFDERTLVLKEREPEAESIQGDDGDWSRRIEDEFNRDLLQERARRELQEIRAALDRIERGTFGFCEETGEPIEDERLLAVPWTRLSVEGIRIREEEARARRRFPQRRVV
jgi:DnaK suppressor protein